MSRRMINAQIARCVAANVLLLLVASGCASNSKPAFASDREPRIIAIRNASGRQAQAITVQSDTDSTDGPRRMGSISPVAQNCTYAFARPSDAPRLPSRVRVIYSFAGGQNKSTTVDLAALRDKATGDRDEAVVFELRAGGEVVAYLDRVHP